MLGKIVELLSINTRLQASTPYALNLLSALVTLVLLGAFATVLCALAAAFGLWLVYSVMRTNGYPLAGAASAALGIFVVILVGVVVVAQRLWRRVQLAIVRLVDVNTPPAAHAVNGAASVATSFVSGLMGHRKAHAGGA